MADSDARASLSASYSDEPVLVTGGASFIGSRLVELLLDAGARVTVADDLSSGHLENLADISERIAFIQGDLRDADIAQKASRGQRSIFHLAAMHGGRGYIDTHPVECMNNLVLDHAVYTAAAEAQVSRVVFASSACAYPTTLQSSATDRGLLPECAAGFDVQGAAFPDGEYGWAKLMGEMQARAFHKQYGMDAIACRLFTAYGPRENESHAVIALIAKALARLDPFPVWGDGTQTRNFTFVDDTALGMALAGARLTGFDVLNVGSPIHTTIQELMEMIFQILEWAPHSIDYQLDKPVGVLSRAADVTKSERMLGWSPHIPLRDGLMRTISWCSANLDHSRLARLDQMLMSR
ncbi:MAG TPA: NAD-dependent epimerase/dehydratase family protein [Candidatus Acidoferrales bacterium]|nr:NAD-dependent epimerase/dehydratase family protein [Candidatus Acidoferrales bacterium]